MIYIVFANLNIYNRYVYEDVIMKQAAAHFFQRGIFKSLNNGRFQK